MPFTGRSQDEQEEPAEGEPRTEEKRQEVPNVSRESAAAVSDESAISLARAAYGAEPFAEATARWAAHSSASAADVARALVLPAWARLPGDAASGPDAERAGDKPTE